MPLTLQARCASTSPRRRRSMTIRASSAFASSRRQAKLSSEPISSNVSWARSGEVPSRMTRFPSVARQRTSEVFITLRACPTFIGGRRPCTVQAWTLKTWLSSRRRRRETVHKRHPSTASTDDVISLRANGPTFGDTLLK